MRLRRDFRVVIVVLVATAISSSICAYIARGWSGLLEGAEVWLTASAVAILVKLFLRRLEPKATADLNERRRMRFLSGIAWGVSSCGVVVAAFEFGLRKVATAAMIVTATTVIVLLLVAWKRILPTAS